MKFLTIFLLIGSAGLAACGGSANNTTVNVSRGPSMTANNGAPANMRGENTNTGYVTNTNTNMPPRMPANVTNISPPSMSGNSNAHNSNIKK